jgi:bacillolysin
MLIRDPRRILRRNPLLLAVTVTLTAAGLAAASMPTFAAMDRPASNAVDALQQLTQNTAGALTHNAITGSAYATVHAVGKQVLMSDSATAQPLARAQNFLSVYGALLGVKDPLTQLRQERLSKDGNGNTHVHMDQYYQGLPVFGARVVVHMNDAGITGTNGVFVGDLDGLSIAPQMSVADLRSRAMAAAHKLHPKAKLAVESSRLMIYRSGLLKGVEGKNFLAYEVMVKGAAGPGLRERLIMNANTGAVLNRINEIHALLNREIYTPGLTTPDPLGTGLSIPVTPLLTEGSALAPADPAFAGDTKGNPASTRPTTLVNIPTDNLYVFAGGTYNLYKNLFGREGYDDGTIDPATGVQREQFQKSVYLVNDQCPNAYWDGTSTNYCPAFDADDVVSHEWSHAYTEYTHGLVYQYQSGALNESYSDIFGETYDLVNGIEGTLGATLTEGKHYDEGGSRFVVGEDLSEAAAAILLRDMWDPDSFPTPSPGSVITSANYACDTADNGGVHTNSGVSNHAYAMLVDGKEFNGYKIPAIGLIKAAHIYFQAETHHQTPTTNYPQHADALEESCADLIGQPLNDVFGKVSSEKITAADCAAVHTATLAVEFRNTPAMTVAQKCDYKPVLEPETSTTQICAAGKHAMATYQQNWESGTVPADWTQGFATTGDSTPTKFSWAIASDLPAPHSGKALYAVDNTGGTCTTGGDISGSYWIDSPALTVPDNASYLSFNHYMQAEAGFDGGNLKYSVDGGAFAIVPPTAFTYNAHSGAFSDAPLIEGVPDPVGLFGNNTNPLAGQAAWTGADQGEATGSWGTTVVDVSKLNAAKGAKIKFRWEFGNDGCGGNVGWYVDNVNFGYCGTTAQPNTLPLANLVASTVSGKVPLPVTFTAGGMDVDFDDKLATYTLDFGDGSTAIAANFATASSMVSHSYTTPGVYNATLTVTDSNGGVSATSTKAISATDASGSTGSGSSGGGTGGGDSGGSSSGGGGGGGAFGISVLLPLFGAAALRRRKRLH